MVMEQRWRYKKEDGMPIWLPFDPCFPCIYCNQPVVALSCGGPAICPNCDCGVNKSGNLWALSDYAYLERNARRRLNELPHDPIWDVYESEWIRRLECQSDLVHWS